MIPQVRPSDIAAWREQAAPGASALLLDVREPWEVQTASVTPEGFELLCIPMSEIPARAASLDPARAIACLCHHGSRSQRVATFLVQNGFTRVANVAGGINAWAQELDPSVPRY